MPQSVDLPAPSVAVPTSALARRAEPVLVGLAGVVLGAGPAAVDGGFFPTTWAWLAFGSLALVTLRLILVARVPLHRLDWLLVGGMAAFAAWVGASTLWTTDRTATLEETLRDVSYAAVVLFVLVFVRRRRVGALLAGTLVGVTLVSAWALLTRLLPDRLDGWDPEAMYRLSGPLGYWNGLGVYAAMGILLALGLAARSPSRVVQVAAGIAPVFLAPTMLFTFSRGAWLALAAGLLVVLLLDARRLQLVATFAAIAPCAAVAVFLAWQSDNLTKSTLTLAQAADEGAWLFRWILVLAAASGLAVLLFRLLADRTDPGRRLRSIAGSALLAAAVTALVVVFVVEGAPWTLADRAIDQFRSATTTQGADVTDRLFDVSANGRLEQWRVSLDQFRDGPVVGAGAGTWEQAWNLERDQPSAVEDSHSLYLEVLGELGLVGLVLLVGALVVPLVAAVRARRRTLTLPALGAYAGFLVHAGVDWDWELAGVTVVGLVAAAALVLTAREGPRERPAPPRVVRFGLPVATALLALASLAAVMSAVPLDRARNAYNRFDFAEAESQARKATDWAPWSAEAYDLLGRAQMAQGQIVKARASFTTAVEKTPDNWELWRDLAAASPPAAAADALRKAIALNPRETELADLAAQLGITT